MDKIINKFKLKFGLKKVEDLTFKERLAYYAKRIPIIKKMAKALGMETWVTLAIVIVAVLALIMIVLGLKFVEGFVLIGYPSIKSIELIDGTAKKGSKKRSAEKREEMEKWLAYWGINGLFLVLESVMPFSNHFLYVTLKMSLFVLLMLP